MLPMTTPPSFPPLPPADAAYAAQPAPFQPGAFPPPDAAIATWGLTKSFGGKTAVNGLSLVVRRGEFFGFLGPNGAGKSTTIKMMVGLLRPTTGSAFIGGGGVWRQPPRAKELVGGLPPQPHPYARPSGPRLIQCS